MTAASFRTLAIQPVLVLILLSAQPAWLQAEEREEARPAELHSEWEPPLPNPTEHDWIQTDTHEWAHGRSLAGQDQRGSRVVDQYAVGLVDDREAESLRSIRLRRSRTASSKDASESSASPSEAHAFSIAPKPCHPSPARPLVLTG